MLQTAGCHGRAIGQHPEKQQDILLAQRAFLDRQEPQLRQCAVHLLLHGQVAQLVSEFHHQVSSEGGKGLVEAFLVLPLERGERDAPQLPRWIDFVEQDLPRLSGNAEPAER